MLSPSPQLVSPTCPSLLQRAAMVEVHAPWLHTSSLSPRTFMPLAPLRRRRLLALGHHCLRVAGHHRWHCAGKATPPASHPHGRDPSLPFPLLLVLVRGRNYLATAIMRSGCGISRIENTLWVPCMPYIHAPRCMQEKI
jgi:hypothetical protein